MTDEPQGKVAHRLQIMFKATATATASSQGLIYTQVEELSFLTQVVYEIKKAKELAQAYLVRRGNGEVVGMIDAAEVLVAIIEQVTIMPDGETAQKNPNAHLMN